MPLIELGFRTKEGQADHQRLSQYGPTTQVVVCPFDLPEKAEDLKAKTVFALIDTGASHSMIDANLAQELGLVAVDKAIVAGVAGHKEHIMYLARILVHQADIEEYGKLLAADLKSGGQEHEVLLGRDFLSKTIMIYDGIRGQVTLASPKTPSA